MHAMRPDSHTQLPHNCLASFFCFCFFLFFVSLEMSLFSEYFCTISALSLYGEYVVRFPLSNCVFLPCDHGLDSFTSPYVKIQLKNIYIYLSIYLSINNYRVLWVECCFLVTINIYIYIYILLYIGSLILYRITLRESQPSLLPILELYSNSVNIDGRPKDTVSNFNVPPEWSSR